MIRNVKITDFTMLDRFEVQGLWWLPEDGENEGSAELSGTLHLDSGEIYLDVLGSFSDSPTKMNKHAYIHGLTVKGEKVTLVHNVMKRENHMPGLSYEGFIVSHFMVGGYFTEIDQAAFKSVKMMSTDMTAWFNHQSFAVTGLKGEAYPSITYTGPDVRHFNVASLNAVIKNESNCVLQRGSESVSYLYNEYFKMIPHEYKSFDWFQKRVSSLNKLLAILTNKSVAFHRIIFQGESEEGKSKQEYHLYISQGQADTKENTKETNMLFDFQSVKDHLESILENWFSKESYLKNVYNLYLSDFNRKDMDLETKFLNAIQTLEVYHRSLGFGKVFTDEKKDAYLDIVAKAIDGQVPEDVQNRIHENLKHINEYSLIKRMEDMKNRIGEDMISLLFNSKNKFDTFNHKVVKTRNYLTHYGDDESDKRYKGVEILYAAILLKALAGVLLFIELGLDRSDILEAIKQDNLLQRIDIAKQEIL